MRRHVIHKYNTIHIHKSINWWDIDESMFLSLVVMENILRHPLFSSTMCNIQWLKSNKFSRSPRLANRWINICINLLMKKSTFLLLREKSSGRKIQNPKSLIGDKPRIKPWFLALGNYASHKNEKEKWMWNVELNRMVKQRIEYYILFNRDWI